MIDYILISLSVLACITSIFMLIRNIKDKKARGKNNNDETEYKNPKEPQDDYMIIGMLFGIAIGSGLTSRFGQNAVSYGMCFGMLIGVLIGKLISKHF